MAATSLFTLEAARAAMTIVQMEDGPSNSKVIQLRDFFWDRVISTMLVLIFGVTSVQAIVSYFSDGRLTCVISENHTTSVQEYFNQLCQKDAPNYGKFYNIALYAEVALLTGLQLFWSQIWNGRIESFKSTVSSMSLKRNKSTGQYESSDHDLARYLERNLESTALTWTYMLKIGGQLVVYFFCIAFLIFYPDLDFSYSAQPPLVFRCYNDSELDGQWPLLDQASLHCVLTELSNQHILRWFNFATLVIIIIANSLGTFLLANSLYYYHLLDYKRVAKFILCTGLRRDHYPEYHYKSGCNRDFEMCSGGFTNSCNFLLVSLFWWCKTSKCSKSAECCCFCGVCSCCSDENFTRGQIPFDMSFLIVRLYGTDTKIGEAFLNVLIDNHLEYLIKNKCTKLQMDNDLDYTTRNECVGLTLEEGDAEEEKKWSFSSLGEIIIDASKTFGEPLHCILITNDNDSLAYLLDADGHNFFKNKMICINFNSNISENSEENLRYRHAHPLVYQVPSQVWAVNEKEHKEFESQLQDAVNSLYINGDHTELHDTIIVLAPLSDETYLNGDLNNTKQRVRSLFERILSGGAVLNCGRRNGLYLLTIVPTKIANKTNVGTEFCGDTEEDGSGFRWLTGSSLSGSYDWEVSRGDLTRGAKRKLKVEGVTYSLRAFKTTRFRSLPVFMFA